MEVYADEDGADIQLSYFNYLRQQSKLVDMIIIVGGVHFPTATIPIHRLKINERSLLIVLC